jgi:hypothetical protein
MRRRAKSQYVSATASCANHAPAGARDLGQIPLGTVSKDRLGRGCHQLPRDRGLRDVVRPRDIGLRFAISESLDSLLPLVGSLSAGGRPKRTPLAFARVLPSLVRARISSRSNSASPPNTVSISRPCAVVVSAHASLSDLKPAPALAITSRMFRRVAGAAR